MDLLCKSWNRDLWHAWRAGEITFEEAAFLARRVEFHSKVDVLPEKLIDALLYIYDLLFEPVCAD